MKIRGVEHGQRRGQQGGEGDCGDARFAEVGRDLFGAVQFSLTKSR
jgi:hypothetical protein